MLRFLKYFLVNFLPVIFILGLIVFLFDRNQQENSREKLIEKQKEYLSLKVDLVKNVLHPLVSDIQFLTNLPSVQRSENLDEEFLQELILFSQSTHYDQIRVIDTIGNETFRVDYRGGKSRIVSELQYKGEREYFKAGLKLNSNETYFSNINLNIENKKIEKPYKPVIRLIAPLFNKNDVKLGLLVINYSLKNLFRDLERFQAPTERSEFYLLNPDGYWLNASKNHKSFGFMFSPLQNEKAETYYPALWDYLKTNDIGSFESDQGLFVFQKLYLSNIAEEYNLLSNGQMSVKGNYPVILVLHSQPHQLFAEITGHRSLLVLSSITLLIGFLAAWVAISRVRERKKDYQLMKTLRKVKQNESLLTVRNAQLESFIRIASHDLREPLATIRSISGTLINMEKEKVAENYEKYLRFIMDCAVRLDSLTRGVLDYAITGRTASIALVDCDQLIDIIKQDLSSSIERTQARIIHENLPTIIGFKIELKQLFQNLISNAIKYRKEDVAPAIAISCEKKERGYLFCIADNGVGINKSDKDRIFKMFERLHNKPGEEGLGIGLAISKRIVDLHQGKVWVEPNQAGGTSFYFTINTPEEDIKT